MKITKTLEEYLVSQARRAGIDPQEIAWPYHE